jgi:hypothetical protein
LVSNIVPIEKKNTKKKRAVDAESFVAVRRTHLHVSKIGPKAFVPEAGG